MIKVIFVILLFLYNTIVFADDIQSLIIQIKTTSGAQKRVLINQLKLKLRAINNEKRQHIVNNMKLKTKAQTISTNSITHRYPNMNFSNGKKFKRQQH